MSRCLRFQEETGSVYNGLAICSSSYCRSEALNLTALLGLISTLDDEHVWQADVAFG